MKYLTILVLSALPMVAHAHAHAQDYKPVCMGIARVAPAIALARDNGVTLSDLERGFMENERQGGGRDLHVYTTRLMNGAASVYHDPRYVKVSSTQVRALAFADCMADPAK